MIAVASAWPSRDKAGRPSYSFSEPFVTPSSRTFSDAVTSFTRFGLVQAVALLPILRSHGLILAEFGYLTVIAPERQALCQRQLEAWIRVGLERHDHLRFTHARFDEQPLLLGTSGQGVEVGARTRLPTRRSCLAETKRRTLAPVLNRSRVMLRGRFRPKPELTRHGREVQEARQFRVRIAALRKRRSCRRRRSTTNPSSLMLPCGSAPGGTQPCTKQASGEGVSA